MSGWVVVLAAGSSERFGRAKARVLWGPAEEPLLARAVRVSLASRHIEGVVVVIPGAEPSLGELVRAFDERRVCVAANEAAKTGMASSIRVGVKLAQERGASFVVLLAVDQPLIEADDLGALAQAVVEGAPAAAAVYAGVVGIPAAFSFLFFDELCLLEGDQGARRLLRDAPIAGLRLITLPHAEVDLDTEAAYREARANRWV